MLPSVYPYVYILLFFVTRIMPGQSSGCCNKPDLDFATDINLLYYECNSKNATIAYPITEPQKLLNKLDVNKRTIFYIFGYRQSPNDPNVQLMMEALCHGQTDNVVLLDWSKYAYGPYFSVFPNAEKVGSLFAQSVQLLVKSGLNISDIYIIGHSLGAHIAGFAGKCNAFKIPRITALDPANKIFYPPGCYLTRNDATWLDVIHTDMGGYGDQMLKGTADYYVNGGHRPQPGCNLIGIPLNNGTFGDLCSHQKSVVIYAYSKWNPNITFLAKKCSSFWSYKLNNCFEVGQTGIGNAAKNKNESLFIDINI